MSKFRRNSIIIIAIEIILIAVFNVVVFTSLNNKNDRAYRVDIKRVENELKAGEVVNPDDYEYVTVVVEFTEDYKGAGKTTVMKLILGLLRPTGGEIKINGSSDLMKERAKIGSLIEDPGIYKNCTAVENMKRYAILFNTSDDEIRELLKLVDLDKTGPKVAGHFSLGMKQRLGIAISLLGHPDILVLDEPINGLDPAGIKEVRDTILRLNKEKGITFLISSHLLDELAKITTHYGIIRDGVLLEEISAKALMDRCTTNLKIVVDNAAEASKMLLKREIINKHEVKDNAIYLYDSFEHPEYIVEALVKDNYKVFEVSKNESAFENYFIERIGR